ncbi:MAG: hypothetical protein HQL81_13020 [Magnetococcales bacterium]|nr:hypothetical protein [Magnetococcales bacterium]
MAPSNLLINGTVFRVTDTAPEIRFCVCCHGFLLATAPRWRLTGDLRSGGSGRCRF